MSNALVIGGGISGVACAEALASRGIDVELVDRGRALGGRMASRTLRETGTSCDGRVVDIGASYFTVRDDRFREVVNGWMARDLAREWTDAFHVADSDGIQGVRSGPMRYAAPGGLRSLVLDLARSLPKVTSGTEITSVALIDGALHADGCIRDAIALCMPNAQALRSLDDSVRSSELLDALDHVTYEPVIAVTLVFDERIWDIDGVFVNDDPVLTWIADDGSRRGDGAPVLVAHVHPVLSARHLDDPDSVIAAVVQTVRRLLGISIAPSWVSAHRWTLARPLAAHPEPCFLDPRGLGLAGDAWADGPRVETAWLSGHLLGQRLGQGLASRAGGA